MNIPILLAIFAMLGGGMLRFGMQIAGANKVYVPSFLMVTYLIPAVVCMVVQLVQRHPFELSLRMTWVSGVVGILLVSTMWSILHAFTSGGQGATIFPIAGLGLMVPVVLSFILFKESFTATKLLGLGLAVSAIIVLSR